jgi:Response regulator containing CheY-like receiver, AAA-type ATPase, and DNA-binding domains
MKILLADDSLTMRRIITKMLNDMGYQDIIAVDCGSDVFPALAANDDIGLILLDWNMPLMNGMDCLKKIKSDPDSENIPVIMVTSEATHSKIVEAIQIGANAYLVKPFEAEALKEKIGKIFTD